MDDAAYCAFSLDEDLDAWVCSKCGFALRNATALGKKRPYAFCRTGAPREAPEAFAQRIGNKSGGPGDELKKSLEWLGFKATASCPCNARAALMNAKGADWCDENIAEIVGWLREEAEKRNIPFIETAARMLVRSAIKRSRAAGLVRAS